MFFFKIVNGQVRSVVKLTTRGHNSPENYPGKFYFIIICHYLMQLSYIPRLGPADVAQKRVNIKHIVKCN